MALRATFYRCHLFSFAGPQTEGVLSRWTQKLRPIGDRVVMSGELVELFVSVDREKHSLTEDSKVRFDILEEDFFLTGGLDDRILAITSTGADAPEGFRVESRKTHFVELPEDQSLEIRVEQYKRQIEGKLEDHILVLDDPAGKRYVILTWWTTERLEDYLNSEFYFIVNVDDRFEDQSEEILDVSPEWVTDEEQEEVDAPFTSFALIEARFGVETASPGTKVELTVETDVPMHGFGASVQISGNDFGVVDQFDFILIGRPPYKTTWRVPNALVAGRYGFRVELLGEELDAVNHLKIQGSLRVQLEGLQDGFATPFANKEYRLLDESGEVMLEGTADSIGQFELDDIPFGETYLELDDVIIDSVRGEAEEPEPLLPEAAGRTFSFVTASEPPEELE